MSGIWIRVQGLMLERLMDAALKQGMRFKRVERPGDRSLLLLMAESQVPRFTALCGRAGIEFEEVSSQGINRLTRRAKARWSLVLCLILCLCALYMVSGRIWLIEAQVVDGDSAEQMELLQAAREAGLYPGMAQSDLKADETAGQLKIQLPQYAFIGIKRQGVRLQIRAVREHEQPEVYQLDQARDLVASRDAVVQKIDVLSGEGCVEAGDTVTKGQLLIRGEEQQTDEANRGVCALGQVTARVWSEGTAEAGLYERVKQPTGRERTGARLELWDWGKDLTYAEPFESEETYVQTLPVGGVFLPLRVVRTRHVETQETVINRDETQIRAQIGLEAMANALSELEEGCAIIDKWVDYSMIEGERLCARAVVEYAVNIAVSREALYQGGN